MWPSRMSLKMSSLLALALGLVSCSYNLAGANPILAPQGGPSGGLASPSASGGTLLTVLLPGGTSVPLSLRQLRALPQATLRIAGNQASGPPLEEILEATGVGKFDTLTLVGKKSIVLSSRDISSEVILRLTDHGTLDLAGEFIPSAKWVKDVREIHVR